MRSTRLTRVFLLPLLPAVLLTSAYGSPPPAPPGDAAPPGLADQILRLEYQFSSEDGEAWTAPNRAHDLRTRIARDGVRIESRLNGTDLAAGGWSLVLTLERFGLDGDLRAVPDAPPDGAPDRVAIHRGPITEWYRNDERGLEQGFTVYHVPGPADRGAEVVLVIGLEGDLNGIPAGPRSLLLRDPWGRNVLRYGGLRVTDAAGRVLESRLLPAPGRIEIRFRDEGAAYPITVDPLVNVAVWNAESNQEGSQFGVTVSTAGDVNGDGLSDVIVGAPDFDADFQQEGRTFLFLANESGLNAEPSWFSAGDGQYTARFGAAVGAAGDVNGDGFGDVVVGVPFHDGSFINEGKVFLFLGSTLGLDPVPAWTFTGDQEGAQFGFSAGTAGDVNGDGLDDVVIGANQYDVDEFDEGAVFLFLGSETGLDGAAASIVEGNQVVARLGASVGTAGDVNGDGFDDVIAGAPGWGVDQFSEGRAVVYLGSAFGLAETPAWSAEANQNNAGFGTKVGTAGDVNGDSYSDIIVGAPLMNTTFSDAGKAFVYHGSSAGPRTTAAWTAESGQAGAMFGSSVGTAGDVNGDGIADVVVGAKSYDLTAGANQGRVYVFFGSERGLAAAPGFTAGIPDQADGGFGAAVGTAGDVNGDGFSDIVIGAPLWDNGEADEGRAFVYLGTPGGLATAVDVALESGQTGAELGFAVAGAGDVNGDGFSDVIVGAPFFDAGKTDEGRVFVYMGGLNGIQTAAPWTAESNRTDGRFGAVVGGAGDVNGDGFSDIFVGVPEHDTQYPDAGAAFVWLGGAGGLGPLGTPANADWSATGEEPGARFGAGAAGAGDVNGDGFGDLVVGAPQDDQERVDGGKALLYLGGQSGPDLTPAWEYAGDQAGAQVGFSVAGAGDVDGDGFDDVLVGAPYFDSSAADAGMAFLFRGGGARGLFDFPAWTRTQPNTGAGMGWSVSSAGDVNGDGFADVVIGFPNFAQLDLEPEGRIYLFLGSPVGLPANRDWTAVLPIGGPWFGHNVAAAGDVNGDGFDDILAGAPFYTNYHPREGGAFLYLGAATLPSTTYAWSSESNHPDARWGWSVAGAGDVNGDGASDVIVGASHYGLSLIHAGRFSLYLGNDGDGKDRPVLQAQVSTPDPIHLSGKSDEQDAFRLRAVGRSPIGRARVGMEWEVKPLGIRFDGEGIGRSPVLLQTGPAGGSQGSSVILEEVAGGLEPGRFYHWRARHVSGSPYFPASPWHSMPPTGPNLTDLRTDGCRDLDGDGFGAPPGEGCAFPGLPDCDDTNPLVAPGLEETCDGLDNTCDGRSDISTMGPTLTVQEFLLSWLPLATSQSFDAVRGSLNLLHASGGDFETAGIVCLANNHPSTSLSHSLQPNPGEGFFFLVRSVDCGGNGTYDSGSPSQIRSRDSRVNAAGSLTCP